MESKYFIMGNKAFDKGDFEKAIHYYQIDLASTESPDQCILNLSISYFEIKQYRKAIEWASKLTKTPSVYSKDALFHMANCHHELKEYEEAERILTGIIQSYPNDSSAYFNRANAREMLNNAVGAEDDRRMQELLEGQKDNNNYQAPELEDVEDYSLEQFNIEKKHLLSDIIDRPDSYNLYFELGNAYVKIREFQKAIDYFMKAIELYTAPFYQKANQNMIAAYLDLQDYKKVIELAHEFLQNSPNHEIVVEMKEKAEKILKGEKSNDKLDERPTLFIVSGGICSGKSTHIANEYPSNYLHIDAGDLFIGLSEGEYYDFPSELEEPLNEFGFELFKMGIRTKRDIVIEVVGSDIAIMEQFFDLAKSIKYRVKIDHITCDIETAKHRNNNRGDDSISSYYTEQFHLNWFRQAVVEYLSN